MRKHFVLEISDGHFSFRRDQASMTAEANLDGFHVIRTSVAAKELSAEKAVGAYKNLAQVERAFRTMKGVDLQVRPIHHWLGDRVKAHVFVCMLAYHVEFQMRRTLAPMLFSEHAPEARTGHPLSRRPSPRRKRSRNASRAKPLTAKPFWHGPICWRIWAR